MQARNQMAKKGGRSSVDPTARSKKIVTPRVHAEKVAYIINGGINHIFPDKGLHVSHCTETSELKNNIMNRCDNILNFEIVS